MVPTGYTLPWKIVDGVKVFHLIAEEVDHEFAPGLRANCWGYNGRVHGPIDRGRRRRPRAHLRHQPAARADHACTGTASSCPNGMDGVGGLTQRAIQPGETFKYEFTLRQHGTFMYHSHHDEMTQMAHGHDGHVRHPSAQRPTPATASTATSPSCSRVGDRPPAPPRPNPNEMTDFNVLTINAKAFPGTAPLVVKTGDRVRIRFGNLSAMDHHPIHLHGYHFKVTATDGGPIPESAQWPETTVLVPRRQHAHHRVRRRRRPATGRCTAT